MYRCNACKEGRYKVIEHTVDGELCEEPFYKKYHNGEDACTQGIGKGALEKQAEATGGQYKADKPHKL